MIREAVDECMGRSMDEQVAATEELPAGSGERPSSEVEPVEISDELPTSGNVGPVSGAPMRGRVSHVPGPVRTVQEAKFHALLKRMISEAIQEAGELPLGAAARRSALPRQIPTQGATSRQDPTTHRAAAGTSGGLNWTGSAPTPRSAETTARRAPVVAGKTPVTAAASNAKASGGAPAGAAPVARTSTFTDPLASGDPAIDASLGIGDRMVYERFIRAAVRKALRNK